MGNFIKNKYRVEIHEFNPCTRNVRITPMIWREKASTTKLVEFVQNYINSLKSGGINSHVSEALNYIPVPHKACIINQNNGKIIAEWNAPKFMAI